MSHNVDTMGLGQGASPNRGTRQRTNSQIGGGLRDRELANLREVEDDLDDD